MNPIRSSRLLLQFLMTMASVTMAMAADLPSGTAKGSCYFTLKLDGGPGKELGGTVVSSGSEAKDPKVDASFHATLK